MKSSLKIYSIANKWHNIQITIKITSSMISLIDLSRHFQICHGIFNKTFSENFREIFMPAKFHEILHNYRYVTYRLHRNNSY